MADVQTSTDDARVAEELLSSSTGEVDHTFNQAVPAITLPPPLVPVALQQHASQPPLRTHQQRQFIPGHDQQLPLSSQVS